MKDKKHNEEKYILDKEDFKSIRERLSTKDPREEIELESKIDLIISKITSRQAYIVIRIMEGFHLQEIAAKLKVSKSTISLEIAKMREILKNLKEII
jgi:DNA-binding NarL/FixJ family response regulator